MKSILTCLFVLCMLLVVSAYADTGPPLVKVEKEKIEYTEAKIARCQVAQVQIQNDLARGLLVRRTAEANRFTSIFAAILRPFKKPSARKLITTEPLLHYDPGNYRLARKTTTKYSNWCLARPQCHIHPQA